MEHTYKQLLTKLLIGSVLSCAPLAAQALTYKTQPAIAGISTDIQLTNLPSNEAGTLYVLPPFGQEQGFNFTTDSNGSALVRLSSATVQDAGSYQLAVETQQESNYEGYTLQVSPSSFSAQQSSISTNTASLQPNSSSKALVAVIARDELGNVLSNRPFKLVTSRPGDQITAVSNETDATGQQFFEVRTSAPGTMTIQAIDLITGDTIVSTASIQVGALNAYGGPSTPTYTQQSATLSQTKPSPFVGSLLNGRTLYGQVTSFSQVDRFEFEVVSSMKTNQAENLAITAVDASGNRVEDYEGTVLLSSTDPQAILPSFGEIRFEPQDLGRKQTFLALSFSTPGTHLLYGEDSSDASIFGQVQITAEGRSTTVIPTETITVFNPIPDTIISSNKVTVEGRSSPFINIIITGGQKELRSETNAEGRFSVEVPLSTNETTHTLQVRSESGNAVSNEIVVKTDTTAPVISGLSFEPVQAVVGENVLVTAEVTDDGAGLASVTLLRNSQPVEMVNTKENTYEYVFVPDQAGDIRFEVIAEDKADNNEVVIGITNIKRKPVGTVTGLSGEIEETTALLTWQPLQETGVTGYRIYIGESKDGFDYQLETTLSEAKINGLQPGQMYRFAITALIGERESEQQSKVLTLEAPNTVLEVTPADSSLLLEWQTPLQNTTIANFRLRYGVQADNLIGQIMINGDLRRYQLTDLINGTLYYLELTPITVTGEVLNDVRSVAEGIPSGDGLKPGAPDPVPASILGKGFGKGKGPTNPPPPGNIIDVPEQAETGLSSLISIIGVVMSALFAIFWWTKRQKRKQHELFFAHMQQQYTQAI